MRQGEPALGPYEMTPVPSPDGAGWWADQSETKEA